MPKDTNRKTYFSIGRNAKDGVFRDVKMPGGSTTRVMSEKVFRRALDSADKKVRESFRAHSYKGKKVSA